MGLIGTDYWKFSLDLDSETLTVGSLTSGGDITITSTDAGATDDPSLILYRNSASPADSDDLGEILFRGRNDNSQDVEYAKIWAEAQDGWAADNNQCELVFATGASEAAVGRVRITKDGHFLPEADNAYNNGNASFRWANLYTSDAHFSNINTGGNDVDGSEGNWTMQEGENDMFLINNLTGKKFKFKLEEV